MFKAATSDKKAEYELNELAKMFAEPGQEDKTIEIPDGLDKNAAKRYLFEVLKAETGKVPDWGTLTGVRPTKLFSQQVRAHGQEAAKAAMKSEYLLSDEKIDLLAETYRTQRPILENSDRSAVGVYIGIPFCPSRCLYCSFTSNVISKPKASAYMKALEKEIRASAEIMARQGMYAESVYIGGGTPSALDDEDFETLLRLTKEYFAGSKTKEFTVECGRPDTITREKLDLIKKYGAGRISINPQTMKDETLKLIGRAHNSEQILKAYDIASGYGFIINMDLIAGLQEESAEDFRRTMEIVLGLKPQNITVHTLAVKRASRLIEEDSDYAYRQADTVRQMLAIASQLLKKDGYQPYYLYRQKHMAGNFENVGYCTEGNASLYNIRIMEENQSIIALGAGGISKMYYPEENRLERIPNVSNYEIYIERIDEMIQRKELGIVL